MSRHRAGWRPPRPHAFIPSSSPEYCDACSRPRENRAQHPERLPTNDYAALEARRYGT